MLAPLAVGTMDPTAVAAFTGVAEPLVRGFAARLLAVRAWRPDGKIEVWSTGAGATSLSDLELIEVYFDRRNPYPKTR